MRCDAKRQSLGGKWRLRLCTVFHTPRLSSLALGWSTLIQNCYVWVRGSARQLHYALFAALHPHTILLPRLNLALFVLAVTQ